MKITKMTPDSIFHLEIWLCRNYAFNFIYLICCKSVLLNFKDAAIFETCQPLLRQVHMKSEFERVVYLLCTVTLCVWRWCSWGNWTRSSMLPASMSAGVSSVTVRTILDGLSSLVLEINRKKEFFVRKMLNQPNQEYFILRKLKL